MNMTPKKFKELLTKRDKGQVSSRAVSQWVLMCPVRDDLNVVYSEYRASLVQRMS
jgi:hypothetical protein